MWKFVAGLTVGYAASTLYAPKSGEELRSELIDSVSRIFHFSGHQASDLEANIAYALNHATMEELMSVRGIGSGLARRIIRHRPYRSVDQILENKVLPGPTFERLKDQLIENAAGD